MDTQSQARLVKYTHGHTGMTLLHEVYKSGSTKRPEILPRPQSPRILFQALASYDEDDEASLALPSARSSL